MSASPTPEAFPPRNGPGTNHLRSADTTVAFRPAPRPVRDGGPVVTVPTFPAPGPHAELGRLRAELAVLLDRVQRLEQGVGTVKPVPAAVPQRRAPGPRPMPPVRPALPPPAAIVAPPPRPAAVPSPLPSPRNAPRTSTPTPPQPPAQTSPRNATARLEDVSAVVLAEVLGIPVVPVTGNFFDDLGADSLLMTRFCARVRSRPDLPNVTIKDIYRGPTVAALAAAAGPRQAPATAMAPAAATAPAPAGRMPVRRDLDPATVRIAVEPRPAAGPDQRPAPVGTVRYLLCGLLQLLFLLGYPALVSTAFAVGAEWVLQGVAPMDVYVRSVQLAGGLFLGTALLPILAKWLLVGRWKPAQFPIWSLRYFRFWLVKTLIRTNPLVRFVGTPLYPFYLRLLGARIGRGATILSPTVPVCTDLVTVGAHTVVRKASSFTGYRVHAGMIQTGPVTIGSFAIVGEATVLDIGSSVGDGSQLGHTSALHAGQSVPDGEHWHGSPAERTHVNYRAVPTVRGGIFRKFVYSVIQLVVLFGAVLPLGTSGLALLVREVPQVQQLLVTYQNTMDQTPLLLDAVIVSSVLLLGGLVAGLLVMATVPRLLALLVRPDRVHRLYGIAYWALRSITRLTNSKFALRLTGDSSYVVGYLRAIGYRFHQVEQTGSNFGTAVAHDSPFLCHVGSGTVVADGLTFVNADYSSSSFAVSPVRIGAHSFLGNAIFYPARARVGDNCLLATKVMVPIDGPVRHGVGLLGSPSFEIPRSTDRDNRLALGPEQRRLGVAAKNRHNLVSIALLLLSRWVYLTLVVLLVRLALDLHAQYGAWTIGVLGAAEVLLTFLYFPVLDAAVRWLAALRPQGVSIYDRGFWRHERYWKVVADTYIPFLNGTPFKAVLWRALGVRVGRRLFDDGCLMTERSFVTIGDHTCLNERSVVQCHSQENDAFKSDRVVIGSGVTVGVGGFVHYGTRLGDGTVLEADSFLMKGEETPPFSRWGGNPAAELDSATYSMSTPRRKS